ncbi:type VI secretion system baseplate subunit TssE [Desulfonema magnum]|uniref:Type VI secretion protein domain-containing protein, lysozyme-like n=1 Tax=Desulfonema magnum TaxID=45655 RepID=A0A975BHZ6_9BACT|nr:type VI secretion system baseplate subunit TssE [Desulfonema magnum]QTA85801.1 Type VI secretion protein domain-containing protein, lysozyme-like [Desulfonema magnum]
MTGPKTAFKSRASLIDRLVDEHPESEREAIPLRTLNKNQLKASIRRDLEWLLNTRTPIPGSLFDRKALTVTDYGVPDFSSYTTTSAVDQQRLAKRLTRAISAFEPRLQNVRVGVEPVIVNEKTLQIVIEVVVKAVVVVDTMRESVSFSTILQKNSEARRVYEQK